MVYVSALVDLDLISVELTKIKNSLGFTVVGHVEDRESSVSILPALSACVVGHKDHVILDFRFKPL